MTPRILFVDDDRNILLGLRRSLRSMRNAWDVDFAEGGEEALVKLEEQSADVIVTDMKMPGINGAELLDRVSAAHPRSIRLILSGEADPDATFRTIVTSHQFLQKPSKTERLIETIKAALAMRDEIPDTDQQTWVTAASRLPVSRSASARLAALVQDGNLAAETVGEVFAAEPALAAKVMQLANSAYFGVGDTIADPKQAVALLGQDLLRSLLQPETLLPAFPEALRTDFYDRSVVTACAVADLAGWIARQRGAAPAAIAHARLAGLLHLLGRQLLCSQAPQVYAEVLASPAAGSDLEAVERQSFAARQADYGAYLAQLWGLPQAVVDAIRYFGRPSDSGVSGGDAEALLAVHAAHGIIAASDAEAPAAALDRCLDGDFLAGENCREAVAGWAGGWAAGEAVA